MTLEPLTQEIYDKAWREGIVVKVNDGRVFAAFGWQFSDPCADDYAFLSDHSGFTVYYSGEAVCGRACAP